MIDFAKGDAVCYRAHLCALPSSHREPGLQFDGTREGTFLRVRKDGFAVVRWNGCDRVSFVNPEILAKKGSGAAVDVNYDASARAVEWILRTTWQQRQGREVPATMAEIEAIGPRLNPERVSYYDAARPDKVCRYSILGTGFAICSACADTLARRAANAKPRTQEEKQQILAFRHADCKLLWGLSPMPACERCGRLGPKRVDGTRPSKAKKSKQQSLLGDV